ncbi:hypothetical protein BBP40_001241 [Aspergillus hancockii]|nr:hypothetical protein BBP40_001241 [Aspergillus hancockii]
MMAVNTYDSPIIKRNPFPRDPVARLNLRAKPKGVERARLKHRTRIETEALAEQEVRAEAARVKAAAERERNPNLLDRFFALPSEVRNHVYRLLLVQPCKFGFAHSFKCEPFYYGYPGPCHHYDGPEGYMNFRCANCYTGGWGSERPIYVSPARSQWSPPMTNEYMCDNCYSEKIRSKVEQHPILSGLKCLCARRQNLHVFLINRQFYKEASHVFWTENCFAFESPKALIEFLSCIRPQTRSLITKISFMIDPDQEGMCLDRRYVQECWRVLRLCDGLTELEVDQFFLSNLHWVLGIKNITPKRRVTFMRTPTKEELTYDQRIWKGVSKRKPVNGILADGLAASMVRQRPMSGKAARALFERNQRAGDDEDEG